MNCFVTGASGFIGANLVHELVARGHQVKALLRPGSDLRGLAGVEFERVEGDLTDRDELAEGMRGCDWCFHVAASYHLWLRDYAPMYAANVEGTRNVLEAAAAAGCARIVYTSTVGCIGLPKPLDGRIDPIRRNHAGVRGADDQSLQALEMAGRTGRRSNSRAKDLPVVIVNPTAPVGPRDVKPTPTGKVIVDFLNRRMPAYLDTGLNWVHVRDVAIGHILAPENGRVGERYILGHAEGNWTMKQAFAVLAEITGVPAPKWRMPYVRRAGRGSPQRSPLPDSRADHPSAARRRAHGEVQDVFQPRESNSRTWPAPNAAPQALADAVNWFRENGYTK